MGARDVMSHPERSEAQRNGVEGPGAMLIKRSSTQNEFELASGGPTLAANGVKPHRGGGFAIAGSLDFATLRSR